MANCFDNSQFSCRFGDAAPLKATTRGSDGTTMQWTQMGLPHRHPEKSEKLQGNTSKVFSWTDNIPFYFWGAKTNSSVILKLLPSNMDFYHLGAGVEVGTAWNFTNPSLNVKTVVMVPITAGRKKKILLRWVCLPVSCTWCATKLRVLARKHFRQNTAFTPWYPTHFCSLMHFSPRIRYLLKKFF